MFNQIAANFKLGKSVKSSPKVSFQKSIRNYTTNSHFPQRTNFTHLSNGLGVATETIPGETATIGLYINTGSAQETHQNNGVSNFLTKVALKGTKNRSERHIREDIESIGGSLSIHACRERTGYVAKVQKQDVPKAVNILSDIIQNSLYRNESIEETKNVVLNDKERYENDEIGSLYSHLYSLAFQGTSLALPIHGTTENIQNFQRDDIINYLNSNYTADRMIVVGTGAVEHNQISSLVEEQFTTIPRSHDHFRPPITHYTGSGVEVLDDSEPFVRGVLAFRAVDHSNANLIPLQIIRKIIGDYNKNYIGGNKVSSKLGEILATEQVGEYMTTFLDTFSSIGLFGVHFKVAAEQADEFCNFFTYELNQIALGASEKEVDLAKNKLKAEVLFSTKGISCLNKSIAKQFLTIGRRVTNEELFARIDAVDHHVVRNVARQYLTDVDPITVAVGDIFHYPDYNQLRSWTYWNRH